MAHFVLLTPDPPGHIYPMGCVGLELMRRGHQVTLLTRTKGVPLAEGLGVAVREVVDDKSLPRPNYHYRWHALNLIGQSWLISLLHGFVHSAELTCAAVPDMLRELKPDMLIACNNVSPAGSIAEHLRIPFMTVHTSLLWNCEPSVPPHTSGWKYSKHWTADWRNRVGMLAWEIYMRPVRRIINRYRKQWNFPPLRGVEDFLSSQAQITQLIEELDYPRRQLPDVVHYVGSLAASRPAAHVDFPWDKLNGKPIVFGSVGTIATSENNNALRAIVAACHGLDAQLVLSLGKFDDKSGNPREILGELPPDALICDYVPQLELLKRTDVLITHAGANTVMEAIGAGVPMIGMPRSADQPGMAARVEYAGLGLRHSFYASRPQELRSKIERILREPAFKRRALEMQQIAQHAGGAAKAAEIAERVLAVGGPVTRADMRRLTFPETATV